MDSGSTKGPSKEDGERLAFMLTQLAEDLVDTVEAMQAKRLNADQARQAAKAQLTWVLNELSST